MGVHFSYFKSKYSHSHSFSLPFKLLDFVVFSVFSLKRNKETSLFSTEQNTQTDKEFWLPALIS